MLSFPVGGVYDLASGQVGMAAAMEEEREAHQAAREGQQVGLHSLAVFQPDFERMPIVKPASADVYQ